MINEYSVNKNTPTFLILHILENIRPWYQVRTGGGGGPSSLASSLRWPLHSNMSESSVERGVSVEWAECHVASGAEHTTQPSLPVISGGI